MPARNKLRCMLPCQLKQAGVFPAQSGVGAGGENPRLPDWASSVQDNTHHHAGAYFKLSHGMDNTRVLRLENRDSNMIARQVGGVLDQPCTCRDRIATLYWGRLLAGSTVREPDAAFAGRRIVTGWDI